MVKLVLKTLKRDIIVDVKETYFMVDMTEMEFLKKALKPEVPKAYFRDHPILKYGSFTKEFQYALKYCYDVKDVSEFVSLSFYKEPVFEKLFTF